MLKGLIFLEKRWNWYFQVMCKISHYVPKIYEVFEIECWRSWADILVITIFNMRPNVLDKKCRNSQQFKESEFSGSVHIYSRVKNITLYTFGSSCVLCIFINNNNTYMYITDKCHEFKLMRYLLLMLHFTLFFQQLQIVKIWILLSQCQKNALATI